jgi:hypothetical protein
MGSRLFLLIRDVAADVSGFLKVIAQNASHQTLKSPARRLGSLILGLNQAS